MKILECLRDTRNVKLDCYTDDRVNNVCTCKKPGARTPSFRSKNIDLYQHLEINETNNVNVTDNWGDFAPMRVNDCFRMPNPFIWWCTTYVQNFNETSCTCLDMFDSALDKNGTIHTNSLYKGLEYDDSSIIQHNTVSSINKIDYEQHRKMSKKSNYSDYHMELLILSFFMLLMIFMYCVVIILRPFKWRKRKNKSELIGLLSGQVVERKKILN